MSSLTFAGEPSLVAKQEINHLLSYLSASGCQFNRNGTWYSSKKAVAHISDKYQYLSNMGLISSTEEFIKLAASQSSMSSEPYQVRCESGVPTQSGPWLTVELGKYRAIAR